MLSHATINIVDKTIIQIAESGKLTDRQKINNWLDAIGEFDPACREEVMRECAANKEARIYYVSRAEEIKAMLSKEESKNETNRAASKN